MCMIDDGEYAEFYNVRNVKRARVPHRCEECFRTIEVGEPYEVAFMVYDNKGQQFATCQHCAAARRWLQVECDGFLHAAVQVDLEEHLTESPLVASRALRWLVIGMRQRWQHRSQFVPVEKIERMVDKALEAAA